MQRGVRMVKSDFNNHISIFVFIFVLFIMGMVFGAIIVNSMNFVQKEDLFFYLKQFFEQMVDRSNPDKTALLKDSILYHVKYMLLLFLLGISIVGMPIITVLLFIKGLVVGFSVGFLVNQMGWYGLLLSSASIAPQNLIIIPVYLLAGALALLFSLTLCKQLFIKRVHQPILQAFAKYSLLFGALLLILVTASLIEVFIAHPLLEVAVKWIYK
ncbi:stage II sporulation protein M [Halobacillus andaensis]|uniref:Stage II sporulation protein M n=1 Tax=Halobacillus andaensis TaxID=1176239 RepID=A0A917AYW1_HALAA|nr:stage II sporulation protein M [Halobacillus andaensis]MBP2003198.1 stage II sporulation protein M [Halobacillus andaensis]GGF08796.1 stage II sporulation protein M [Halobacillus andaensis]